LASFKDKAQQVRDTAFQAGANMQRQSRQAPFTSAQAGTPTGGSQRGPKMPPPDFARWDVAKQKEWLEKNGYVRPDTY